MSEQMTLRELRTRIQPTAEMKTPTMRWLLTHGTPIETYVDGDYKMTVFENGFVLAVSGKRYTVFHAEKCRNYKYFHPDYTPNDPVYGKPDPVDESVFLDQPWPVRMMLMADDAFQENEDHREKDWLSRHPEIPDDKNWMNGGHESFEAKLITKMDLEDALECLTEKQRASITLYFEQGYTLQEAGEILHISKESFADRLDSATRKLSKIL